MNTDKKRHIGLQNESSLHSDIKAWYSKPGDRFEEKFDNYIIDIIRGQILIEIQTRHLYQIKDKIRNLVQKKPVILVYPIAKEKWITRVSLGGKILGKRKSPKAGNIINLFDELVRIPDLINLDNFSIEVLFITLEEIRIEDGKGSWRRKGVSISDKKLIEVTGREIFEKKEDFLRFLPENISRTFTNKELSAITQISIRQIRKLTYTLRKMGLLTTAGKIKKELLYQIIL
jgi:hypothetical protein